MYEAIIFVAHTVRRFRVESPNLSEVKMGFRALLCPIGLKLRFVPIPQSQ